MLQRRTNETQETITEWFTGITGGKLPSLQSAVDRIREEHDELVSAVDGSEGLDAICVRACGRGDLHTFMTATIAGVPNLQAYIKT